MLGGARPPERLNRDLGVIRVCYHTYSNPPDVPSRGPGCTTPEDEDLGCSDLTWQALSPAGRIRVLARSRFGARTAAARVDRFFEEPRLAGCDDV